MTLDSIEYDYWNIFLFETKPFMTYPSRLLQPLSYSLLFYEKKIL